MWPGNPFRDRHLLPDARAVVSRSEKMKTHAASIADEFLIREGTCALAVTITDVPPLGPGTIEREHLCGAQIVTVCAPSHRVAEIAGPIPREEFGGHIQLVVTDNRPDAPETRHGVAGERQ